MLRSEKDDWTPAQIKEFLLAVIDSADKRYEAHFLSQDAAVKSALAANNRATEIAEAASEKWRANATEWRATMNDREIEFAKRIETDLQFAALVSRITALENARYETEGRGSGISTSWAFFIGIAGLVLAGVTSLIVYSR